MHVCKGKKNANNGKSEECIVSKSVSQVNDTQKIIKSVGGSVIRSSDYLLEHRNTPFIRHIIVKMICLAKKSGVEIFYEDNKSVCIKIENIKLLDYYNKEYIVILIKSQMNQLDRIFCGRFNVPALNFSFFDVNHFLEDNSNGNSHNEKGSLLQCIHDHFNKGICTFDAARSCIIPYNRVKKFSGFEHNCSHRRDDVGKNNFIKLLRGMKNIYFIDITDPKAFFEVYKSVLSSILGYKFLSFLSPDGKSVKYISCIVDFRGEKKLIGFHRIKYALFYPEEDITNKEIDHIDRNPRNNSIKNLRAVTRSQNQINKSKSRKGKEYSFKSLEELMKLGPLYQLDSYQTKNQTFNFKELGRYLYFGENGELYTKVKKNDTILRVCNVTTSGGRTKYYQLSCGNKTVYTTDEKGNTKRIVKQLKVCINKNNLVKALNGTYKYKVEYTNVKL